jgi:hypothetical protein
MTIALAKWTLQDYHQMIAAGILDGRPLESSECLAFDGLCPLQ